jgi:hypothetical protein
MIETYTGRIVDPLGLRAEDVYIEDVAHALSNLCRFTGHTSAFYSVAEHSVHVSLMVPREHALMGLLHDAAEAYLGDVSSPLKAHVMIGPRTFEEVEAFAMGVILQALGAKGAPGHKAHVKSADMTLLHVEGSALLPPAGWQKTCVTLPLPCLPPPRAEALFLARYKELTCNEEPQSRCSEDSSCPSGAQQPEYRPHPTSQTSRHHINPLAAGGSSS